MARVYKTTYEDVYKFHAKFGRVPPLDRGDSYWSELVEAMSAYSTAHDDKFTTALLVAVVEELEREYLAVQGNEK
jgi:hypothetical protein